MRRIITCMFSGFLFIPGYDQEIGANFNHDPEIINFEYLKKTPVEWIHTTPYIFDYILGQKDIANEAGLNKIIEAKKRGYKVAFGFRWDFKKYGLDIPSPNSDSEKEYFDVAEKILERVGSSIDIFTLGNEPNLETKDQDLYSNKEGIVPIVLFTKRLLANVVEPYYLKHKELKRTDVYVGSLTRLFLKTEQEIPGVIGLILLAQNDSRIKGLSIHLHVSDSVDIEKAFRFVRSLLPSKPIIVPEFSLFRLYSQHNSDELGDNPDGVSFAARQRWADTHQVYPKPREK